MENKPKRLIKGIDEAKEHMKNLRCKRTGCTKVADTPTEIFQPVAIKKKCKKDLNVDFS